MAMPTTSLRTTRLAALTAAVSYAAVFALAVFANFFVRIGLIDPDSPASTMAAIRDQEGLFRLGLAAFSIIFILDIAIAWGLYVVLKPAGQAVSLHAAWFRIAYSVMLAVATVFLSLGMEVALQPSGLDAEVGMLLLNAFTVTWSIGLIAFGVHLMLVGVIMYRSRLAPRVLGLALAASGLAYIADSVLQISLVNYAAISSVMMTIVAILSVVSELAVTVWLFWMAWQKRPAQDRQLLGSEAH